MYTVIFAPGTNSYLPQMCKYTSSCIDENKTVRCSKGKSLWDVNKCLCVQFSEIYRPTDNDSWDIQMLTMFNKLLQHGIHYRDSLEGDILNYGVDLRKYNLGQEADIQAIQNTYEQSTGDILAFGVSRGSCALINWISIHQPDRIKALVLEGCPTSVEDIIQHSTGYLHHAYSIFGKLIPRLTSYKSQGLSAKNNLLQLPKDLPILFITSKNDWVVPWTIPWGLYTTLKENGYNVHIIILERAGHIDYLSNNPEDTQTYLEGYYKFIQGI